MLGKVPTLLLRLSCILQTLHDSYDHIMNVDISLRFKLDKAFEDHLNNHLKRDIKLEICLKSVERAYKLLEYFNKNKLLLAGYNIDINSEIEVIFNNLITELEAASNDVISIESSIIKDILEADTSKVSLTQINAKLSRKCTMAILSPVVKTLIDKNLGKSVSEKNLNGPKTKYFQKFYLAEIDISTAHFLQEHSVDLDKFNTVNASFADENLTGNNL